MEDSQRCDVCHADDSRKLIHWFDDFDTDPKTGKSTSTKRNLCTVCAKVIDKRIKMVLPDIRPRSVADNLRERLKV